MKKILSVLLILVMLLAIMPLTVFATEGTDGLVFELSDNGKYYIVTGYIGSSTQVTIPSKYNGKTVLKIGDYAFYKCVDITSITIPDSVNAIGDYAFAARYDINDENYIASSLVRVTMGDSVKTIGKNAFYYCETLTNITLSNALTTIGDYAFARCLRLEIITLPNSLTKLGEGAFAYCFELKSITLPNSLTAVNDFAFYCCESLTNITIPDSVTTIGESAFKECDSLTSVTIKNAVTTIGFGVFWGCGNLSDIYCEAKSEPFGWSTYWKQGCGATVHWGYKPVPVKITAQPKNVSVQSGKIARVTVNATGEGLTYKWYFKNKGDSKFTLTNSYKNNTYSLEMNGTRAGRQVYCVITDKYGNEVKTNTVTLGMAVKITKQPTTVSVQSGKQAKVTVSASGEGKTYKWYYKDKNATKFTLTNSFKGDSYYVEMNGTRAGRQIYCVITDKYGNSVKTDVVTLGMAVKITKQPTSVTVANGSQAKVTVTASGEGKTYKWYFKDKGATKFSLTNSFKGDSYYVTMTNVRAGRQIYCVITDKYGNSVKTNTVTLNKK